MVTITADILLLDEVHFLLAALTKEGHGHFCSFNGYNLNGHTQRRPLHNFAQRRMDMHRAS